MPNGNVNIVEYNPDWPSLFEQEKKRLMEICGSSIIAIEHIGSTSVPGLGAKDIIDMVVAVEKIEIADNSLIDIITAMGYNYAKHQEEFFPNRRLFSTIPGEMDYYCHVHMVELDTEFWKRHLIFRNYLREFSDIRDEYYKLKLTLSQTHNTKDTRILYTTSKTEFIEDVVENAKQYYNMDF